MKYKLIILIILWIAIAPITISVYADRNSSIDELDTISDEALQLVRSERYEEAKKILDYFSNQFSTVSITDGKFTMDELKILTGAHDEAVEAISNGSMNTNDRINSVTRFRLAVDAVSSGEEPLWIQMEDPVMTTYREMKDAAFQKNKEIFDSKLDDFLTLYQIIYPSLKLDVTPAQFQTVNTLVEYVGTYRLQIYNNNEDQVELNNLEAELQDVFNQVYKDEADPSLWWVIISTGSIIILTLSYVGWRKYIGDKQEEKQKSKNRS